MSIGASASGTIVVGSLGNSWTWSRDASWDLTHPPCPRSEPVQPQLKLDCKISNITIDPNKTALMIIDMQNILMSSALGSPTSVPAMFQAQDALVHYGIPGARQASIQILWLNWGLTEEDLETIPPASLRVFGWPADCDMPDYGISYRTIAVDDDDDNFITYGECPRSSGMGMELGRVVLEDGKSIDAGRALMRGTLNTKLHGPLASAWEDGCKATRPDVLLYKNRNSGL